MVQGWEADRSENPIVKKQPVLITDATRSPEEQFRSRQIRYVTMMSLRALCLIVGAILFSARPPLLGLWLILCAAGMVFLPWAAVLIANDRPARTKAQRAAAAAEHEREQQMIAQHSAEMVEYLTIDSEVVEPEEGTRWVPPAAPEHERKQR
jgi:hypothetical protein